MEKDIQRELVSRDKLEKQREKLMQMIAERMEAGESLESPEILRQNQALDDALNALSADEREKLIGE